MLMYLLPNIYDATIWKVHCFNFSTKVIIVFVAVRLLHCCTMTIPTSFMATTPPPPCSFTNGCHNFLLYSFFSFTFVLALAQTIQVCMCGCIVQSLLWQQQSAATLCCWLWHYSSMFIFAIFYFSKDFAHLCNSWHTHTHTHSCFYNWRILLAFTHMWHYIFNCCMPHSFAHTHTHTSRHVWMYCCCMVSVQTLATCALQPFLAACNMGSVVRQKLARMVSLFSTAAKGARHEDTRRVWYTTRLSLVDQTAKINIHDGVCVNVYTIS